MKPSEDRKSIRVDVISDPVCPWCYVGKRRLDQAAALTADRFDVEVAWHPFQLNPTLPPEGVDWETYAVEKFGSLERIREMQGRLAEVGKDVGILFDFDGVKRAPNTFDAHRLLSLALPSGLQQDVVEALFRAHFVEGRDIGDRATLTSIAESVGMDPTQIRQAFEEGAAAEEVRDGLLQVRQLGIQAVPFFIVGRRFGIAGAQPAEQLVEALERAAAED